MRRVTVATVLAGLTAGGGAAAPQQHPGARTLLATHSRITQFARDGEWVAWTTVRKGCRRRLHLLSLRTGREVRVDQVDYHIACADGPLVLAGGRAAWATVNGHGNTEVDFAIDTAGPRNPKPRTVRTMATLLGDYEPEPPLPPLAGRASVLVYFRHDELS